MQMAIPTYYALTQRGSSGPDAALIQTWLNGIRDQCTWHAELVTDGKFGLKSENAVREFQTKNELTADGKVGRSTWNALSAKYTAKHGTGVPYPGIAVRSGMAGGVVQYLQQKLNTLGESLSADGKYGAKTVEAVRRFQSRSGLTADGIVGKTTWEKMF